MAKAAKELISSKIAAEIGTKIVSERLMPGAVLKGEVEASDGLNVSRSAYREAIRMLAAKGLVYSRPKYGTRVADKKGWHLLDPDILRWIFIGEPPHDLLVSLFELRKMIEPEAAALAAERHSPEQLEDMSRTLQVMRRETLHSEAGREADQHFHTALLLASCNSFLQALSASVTAAVTWSTAFKVRTHRLERNAVPDHARVFYAIAARDPVAARESMLQLIELAFCDATKAEPEGD